MQICNIYWNSVRDEEGIQDRNDTGSFGLIHFYYAVRGKIRFVLKMISITALIQINKRKQGNKQINIRANKK